MNQYLIVAFVILCAVAVVALIYYIYVATLFKNGTYASKIIGGFLKRYCLSRNFKVLSDVNLSDKKDSLHSDFVLVGFFGILLVHVLQIKEDLYGDLKEDSWTLSDKGNKTSIPNPVKTSHANIEAFRAMLARRKIYRIPLEEMVVTIGFGKEPSLYLTNLAGSTPTITYKQMKKLLSSSKFEKDNDLDVDMLLATIRELQSNH